MTVARGSSVTGLLSLLTITGLSVVSLKVRFYRYHLETPEPMLIETIIARTVGFITDPLRHDSTEPTVMESLVYWIMSSMGADNSWKIDEVSKRSERLLQKQGKIPKDTDPVFLSPFSSVSPSVSSSPSPPPSIPIPAPRRTSPRVAVTRSSRQTPEIIYTKQQLESIRSSKRQRQIEDEIKRDMKRDRADDGAWQPKVRMHESSPYVRKPVKCFPLTVMDFTGASHSIARLVSRTR